MLIYDDAPTIRWAILKRLDKEPGVKICDVRIVRLDSKQTAGIKAPVGAIGVAVELLYGETLEIRSAFVLPPHFEHAHLVEEIDEIAEQVKAARRNYWMLGRPSAMPMQELQGTGLAGRWKRYG